jgi:integrase
MGIKEESVESGTLWEGTDIQNLIRHRKSGRFYGRFRAHGKRKFVSLKTNKKTVAKIRLLEEAAKIEKSRQVTGPALKMRDLYLVLRERNQGDIDSAEATRMAREDNLKRIEKTWPELAERAPADVKLAEIFEWSRRARAATYRVPNTTKARKYSAGSVNKSVDMLKRLFRIALEKGAITRTPFDEEHSEKGRLKAQVTKKQIILPDSGKVEAMFAALAAPDCGKAPAGLRARILEEARQTAEFVRFMAYTGTRQMEAARAMWEDCRENGMFLRGTKTQSSRERLLPWNPALTSLIGEIRARWLKMGKMCEGKLFTIQEAQNSLTRACRVVGIPRFTHHTLRHYFATVAIESGVDIPVLASWLGHSDGGALVMSTYGHMRIRHSQAQAQQINFGSAACFASDCE